MPELPEVETVVRDLRPLIVGRTIMSVSLGAEKLRQPWNKSWNDKVAGCRIVSLARRGKWILADLNGQHLLLHLGMTGQLTVHGAKEERADHVHVIFHFDNRQELRFRDVRRFGGATLFENEAAVRNHLDARLGPEPFNLDPAYFREKLLATNRTLKAVLLDQKLLAGVGNIYADESCFRSGLHPGRRADSLSAAEIDALRTAVEAVLTKAVEGRGSTIRDYIGGSGLAGEFQNEFAVYGRTGEACPTCRTTIEVLRIAGRSSHFCPLCQR